MTEDEASAFNWIRTTLEELKLTKPEQILQFFEDTKMDMMKGGRITMGYKGRGVAVAEQVDELISLADDETKLSPHSVSFYIKFVEYVFGKLEVMSQASAPDHDVGLFNYMQHFGKTKFTSLLNDISSNYQSEIKRFKEKNERGLDELIASQERDDTGRKNKMALNETHLTQLANEIDLSGGYFDAKRMLKAAKRRELFFSVEKKPGAYLSAFIDEYCTGLLDTFNNLLNIVNMVRLLSPESLSESNPPQKLIKFNEYGRICHQALGTDTREQVKSNIRDALQGHLRKLFKSVVDSN